MACNLGQITIARFADRTDLLPTLQQWFESEWPRHYGPAGAGDARRDLCAYSNRQGLPIGFVALRGARLCGFAALKDEPIPGYEHLRPWAGAAVVPPALRGQGIGGALLAAIEAEARAQGYARMYCATATSASLLVRSGWPLREQVMHEGQVLGVYEKAL